MKKKIILQTKLQKYLPDYSLFTCTKAYNPELIQLIALIFVYTGAMTHLFFITEIVITI